MRVIPSVLFFFLLWACVDRLQFDIPKSNNYGVVVDGFISDQPGPYTVKITKAFDIESKETIKTPITVRHLILSDNQGFSEELAESSAGVYQTKITGIRGQVGGVYKLRVELLDGKIYESALDTLHPSGEMDSVYYSFKRTTIFNGATEYGFDIFANSTAGNNSTKRFMWKMEGTFQSETRPELFVGGCFFTDGKCNYVPPCSGYRNIGTQASPQIEKVFPCECCKCWYTIFNHKPILSDDYFSTAQNFNGIAIHHLPIDPWIFMHKIHIKVSQLSLTDRSFRFVKTIRDQKNAVNSLFQPVSGKIPVNFIQLAGNETPIQGIFYATSIVSKSLFIDRNDVPNLSMIPSLDAPGIGWLSCLDLFPNATTVKPEFWED